MTRARLLDLLSTALVGTALLAGAPSLAAADDPEPEVSDQEEPTTPASDPMHLRWDRMLGVELTGGVDTPYGVIGGALLVEPLRNLRIDLGGGVSRDGARVAGGIGLVLPQDHFALVLHMGAAGGPLTWDSDRAVHIHRYWSFAAFFNWSLGLEYRFDEGVLLRLYAGGETVLNSAHDSCSETGADTTTGLTANCVTSLGDHPSRLYVGLSVGYMFDIYP